MKKLIYLSIEEAEEVMDSLEWAVDDYEKQDDIDREMYKTYRSTYHSIKQQLKVLQHSTMYNYV